MQIDLKHKPTVRTKQHHLSPTDFTPASSQPFCVVMLGKRGKLCFAKFFVLFFFQLIAYGAATVGLWKTLQKKIAVMIENH